MIRYTIRMVAVGSDEKDLIWKVRQRLLNLPFKPTSSIFSPVAELVLPQWGSIRLMELRVSVPAVLSKDTGQHMMREINEEVIAWCVDF